MNKKRLQFFIVVKSAVLKQKMLKYYQQIQRTDTSHRIYCSQRPVIHDIFKLRRHAQGTLLWCRAPCRGQGAKPPEAEGF